MKTTWPQRALDDICDLDIGRTPPRAERRYWGPGHPWLSIADMNQGRDLVTTKETITDVAVRECKCRAVPAGTVLLSFKLSIGKVGIAAREMFTNEAIAALRFRRPEEMDAGYMYHALRHADLEGVGERAVKGITLNLRSLGALKVPVPPLAEQRRIAAVLDKADAIRRRRRESLRLLDEFLRSAFLEMFGDPVRNEKGWDVVKLGDVLVRPLRNGLSPAKGGAVTARVLTLTAITGSHFEPSAVKTSPFAHEPAQDQFAELQDFLICRGNGNRQLMGRAKFPRDLESNTAFPDTMIAARVDLTRVEPSYLETVWDMPAVRRALEHGARTTSGIHKVNQGVLASVRFPLPPVEVQKRFTQVKDRVERIRTRLANGLSDQLFESLAQQAFRGEP